MCRCRQIGSTGFTAGDVAVETGDQSLFFPPGVPGGPSTGGGLPSGKGTKDNPFELPGIPVNVTRSNFPWWLVIVLAILVILEANT